MINDAQIFLDSLSSSQRSDDPYLHFFLENAFDQNLLAELNTLPFKPRDLNYERGAREEFNAERYYLSPEVNTQHRAAQRTADIFSNPDVIHAFEKAGDRSLKGSLLRIEYAVDSGHFWLSPHTDIGPKLFTMLIYLSEGENSDSWGTDLYRDAETHYAAAPYAANNALIFYPTKNTWHGFERREIKGIRRSLIVNYVTDEWRNRHELVHPTQPVA